MKIRYLLLAAAVTAVSAFGLTACNGDLEDDDNGTVNDSEHVHTYSEEWSYNSQFHWHAPDCGHNVEISDKAAHTFIDGVCVVCGYYEIEYTSLKFILNDDESSYTVTGNDATAQEITIPAVYKDLPVTVIGNSAFRDYVNLETVNIPESIERIENLAFYGCKSITEITLPESLTALCGCAFTNCTSLKSITLPDSLTTLEYSVFDGTAYFANLNNWTNGVLYIGKHLVRALNIISGYYAVRDNTLTIAALSFDGCSNLTALTMPDSVKQIGTLAFNNCYALNNIKLSDSLECVGALAFHGCNALQELTLPASLKQLEPFALSALTQINYLGTPDEWDSVDKAEYCISEACRITFPEN